MINFKATSKGHLVGVFRDRFGAECSIQESSYPDEPCVWLGVEVDSGGDALLNGRMHLNRTEAASLIEVLRHFVNEGAIGLYGPEDFHIGGWVSGIGNDNYGVQGRIIEIRPKDAVTIQDRSVPGALGRHVCSWEVLASRWSPTEAPPEGRSIFDHLEEED